MKPYVTLAVVAAVAVMLVASAAIATDDVFAGKKKRYNQALSQANACGNGELPLNVFCSNSASQIQGDGNSVSSSSSQAAD